MEDNKLIIDVLNNNSKAEELIYLKYVKIVESYLIKNYGMSNYDDDVSEIMIKVFTKLHTFDYEKSKFMSWVLNITKNHMIDKWRSDTITITNTGDEPYYYNTTSNTIELAANDFNVNITTTSTYKTQLTDNDLNYGCSYSTGAEFENCNSINFLSTQVSAKDFTLLNMKYVEGYDYNEIGKEFNVTSSTISNRVNYIKTKLKKNNTEIIYE